MIQCCWHTLTLCFSTPVKSWSSEHFLCLGLIMDIMWRFHFVLNLHESVFFWLNISKLYYFYFFKASFCVCLFLIFWDFFPLIYNNNTLILWSSLNLVTLWNVLVLDSGILNKNTSRRFVQCQCCEQTLLIRRFQSRFQVTSSKMPWQADGSVSSGPYWSVTLRKSLPW